MSDTIDIASTMNESSVTSKDIITNDISTKTITINNKEIVKIVDNIDTPSSKEIPSTIAISEVVSNVQRILDGFGNSIKGLTKNTSISDPIIQPYFFDNGTWDHDLFTLANGNASYQIKDITDNPELRVKSIYFTEIGRYFVEVNISVLDSGKISLYDGNYTELAYRDMVGTLSFEYNVTNIDTAILICAVKNATIGSYIKIDSIFVFHVEDSLDKYFDHKTKVLASGGGSTLVSLQKLQAELTLLETKLKEFVNTALAADLTDMSIHIENTTDNVHGVTPAQIGAAKDVHSHPKSDITDFAHDHNLNELSGYNALIISIGNAVAGLQPIIDDLEAHKDNKLNPHGVTKNQINLDKVENFPPATTTEAINGIPDRYIDPFNVHQIIDSKIVSLDTDKVLISTPNYKFNFNLSDYPDNKVALELKPNSRYIIQFKSYDDNLKKFRIMYDSSGAINYNNNLFMGRTYNGEDNAGWFTNMSVDGYHIALSNLGVVGGSGELILIPSIKMLTGQYIGRTISNVQYPLTINSIIDNETTLNTIYFMSVDGSEINMDICVVEMNLTNILPSMIVDATSVGTIDSKVGDPPNGWMILDGSELFRTAGIELFDLANSKGLVISESEWQDNVNTFGYCNYFSEGNGTTTFRLPKFEDVQFTNLYSPMIKIKNTQLEQPTELMYRYIWND